MKKILYTLVIGLEVFMLSVGPAAAVTDTARVTATVDSSSAISVDALIAFGTIQGVLGTYRFRQNSPAVASVSYFAAGPYEIRVWTDNGVGPLDATNPALDVRGFIRDGTGTADANRLHPKIWCPNFSGNAFVDVDDGPQLMTTSVQTDYLWKGFDLDQDDVFDPDNPQVHPIAPLETKTFNEATLKQDINGDGDITDEITATLDDKVTEGPSFVWLREYESFHHTNQMHELDTLADARTYRSVLAWNTLGRGDGSLGNPFPVVLAVDLTGVVNGTYDSNNNGPTPVDPTYSEGIPDKAQDGVAFELMLF